MKKTTFALMTALAALTSTHAFAAEQIAQLCTSEEVQGVYLVTMTEGNNPQFIVQKGGAILAGDLKPLFTPLILTKTIHGYEFTDGTQTQTVADGKYIVKDNKTNHSTVFESCMAAPQTLVNLSQGKPSDLPADVKPDQYMRMYTDAVFEQNSINSQSWNGPDDNYVPPKITEEDKQRWASYKVLADKHASILEPIQKEHWAKRDADLEAQTLAAANYTSMPVTCDLIVNARTNDKSDYRPIAYVKNGIQLAPEAGLLRATFTRAFAKKPETMVLVYIARHSVTNAPNVFPDFDPAIDVPADKDISYSAWNCK